MPLPPDLLAAIDLYVDTSGDATHEGVVAHLLEAGHLQLPPGAANLTPDAAARVALGRFRGAYPEPPPPPEGS